MTTCKREWIFGDLQVLKLQYVDLQGRSKITHKLRQMWAWMQIDIQLYHFPYRNPSDVALQNYKIRPFPTERFFFFPQHLSCGSGLGLQYVPFFNPACPLV